MVAPLAGIRVLEVASWLAAPSCAALMADMGADVIKVEPPGGDAYRHSASRAIDGAADLQTTYAFELDNRGKRSITVNLGAPGAAQVIGRLVERADIFITNLIQPRRLNYSLTVADLRALNPRLIYVSFSGYGAETPDAHRAGFDFAAFWARGGVQALLGEPDAPPPPCRGGQGDHTTALNLLASTLAALRLRDLTGEGQTVEVTLVGTGLWTVGSDLSGVLQTRRQPERHDRARPQNPLRNSYRCRDGKWLMLVMAQPDRYWPHLCRALDRPEWISDPRFDSLRKRSESSAALTAELDAIFGAADYAAFPPKLDAAGLIWAPVAELPDVIDDPTVRALGSFSPVTHPRLGSFETLSAPFRIEGADIAVRGPAPSPGEHTADVLAEIGFGDEEVATFATDGVFG